MLDRVFSVATGLCVRFRRRNRSIRVGDEMIVTWPAASGVSDFAPLRCFLAMRGGTGQGIRQLRAGVRIAACAAAFGITLARLWSARSATPQARHIVLPWGPDEHQGGEIERSQSARFLRIWSCHGSLRDWILSKGMGLESLGTFSLARETGAS